MSSPGSVEITKLPVREQLRQGFKEMGRASWSSAKNFGMVGAIFAGTECCIEGVCLLFCFLPFSYLIHSARISLVNHFDEWPEETSPIQSYGGEG